MQQEGKTSTSVARASTGKHIRLSLGKVHPPHQDSIQRLIGAFGKYQLRLCCIVCLSKFFIAFQQMAIIFLSPKVDYKCPDTNQETCPCSNPQFDKEIFTHTITMQWNLICERKWMVSFTQMIFQLGTLLGSVLFGMASDRYGRRKPMLVASMLMFAGGVIGALIPEFWSFNLIRLILGISIGGSMVTGFVIVMEFVGSQYRDIISALYQVPFNLGLILLPAFGYFLRDYTHFQIGISVPSVILISYFWLVPETPRWLIAMKKTDKAIEIIARVAETNGRPTDKIRSEVETYQANIEKENLKKGTILDLFRTPNLRKNIITMSYNWLACSYCFYGVSQYVGQLSGDVFVNVAASASVTLLGTLLSIPLMKILGRRTIVIMFNFISAFCLFVLAVVPEGTGSIVAASVGVVASFIVFSVVYLYCSELFPTVIRSAAIGFSSMMARVGSMVAPFVIELGSYNHWLAPVVFGIVPFIAGFVTFLMPETKGCELMTTIEEGEQFEKKRRESEEL